ncbi:MAG: hypothetical protein MR328_06430 [Firmicutes bacterium]|nr:hypothetical protein [Bacillota bacterium]
MKNKVVSLDEKKVFPSALERFIQTCGFDLDRKKHQRMMQMAYDVRENGLDGIDIKAVVSYYGPEVFRGGKIEAEGQEIQCNYFSQMPEGAVEGVYFYVLTVGECLFPSEEQIMDFLYADIWGTSYVDAGITELKHGFLENDLKDRFPERELYLSEEFGPGYFGMPVIESKKFMNLLDADLIDVWVKDSGLMIPQKTCTGLYLVLNRNDIKADVACMQCRGNSAGCKFCAIRAEMEKAEEK